MCYIAYKEKLEEKESMHNKMDRAKDMELEIEKLKKLLGNGSLNLNSINVLAESNRKPATNINTDMIDLSGWSRGGGWNGWISTPLSNSISAYNHAPI